ncbi:preprotein translocase subunit YajC [Tuberibacillus sp. Marseille-P3662]|uniref:preprotein translocase subunit YajC n=1 Tax=Tuberibacillus sp. Marseille-P3662 TaxID=1965358 RepID=UPI000A1C9DCF|nr:preprotein translocase subunit YajC [Tuberibacillus sp. Marseille-P3662]
MLQTIIPLILFLAVFYFLLIRPQQKRQKQTQQMQADLQKGDNVVTIGGLHGVVDVIEDDKVTIKSHNTKLTFDRASIRSVVEKATSTEQPTEE